MLYPELQKNIGYNFKNEKLLELALTHSSYTNEHGLGHAQCNERIEFLGDAVLELASSDYLFREREEFTEGHMTRLRASLVCETSLAQVAREIELGKHIKLGKGEDLGGGRKRDSILSDALESLIGAIYLDSGFTSAKEFVYRFIMQDIENRHLFFDSKTILQEMVQAGTNDEIRYELVSSQGPDHDRTFVSSVFIGGKKYGTGAGRSKKLSEQQAAYEAIKEIKKSEK